MMDIILLICLFVQVKNFTTRVAVPFRGLDVHAKHTESCSNITTV
jgi:hypothetical protein